MDTEKYVVKNIQMYKDLDEFLKELREEQTEKSNCLNRKN